MGTKVREVWLEDLGVTFCHEPAHEFQPHRVKPMGFPAGDPEVRPLPWVPSCPQ